MCVSHDGAWGRPRTLIVLLVAATVAAWVWPWQAYADRPGLLGRMLLA
jgi:hypothetical protein